MVSYFPFNLNWIFLGIFRNILGCRHRYSKSDPGACSRSSWFLSRSYVFLGISKKRDKMSFLTNCVPIFVFVCFGISRKVDQLCCLFWQTVSGYMCFFALESLGRRTRYAVFFDKLCASIHLRSFPRNTVRLTIWTVLTILTKYGISAGVGRQRIRPNWKVFLYLQNRRWAS